MGARFPTLVHVWLAGLVLAILLRCFLMPVPPNDLWWQLAMGRLIAGQGAIPVHDVFSYTRDGAPYFNQPWLAQLVMYALHLVGGVPLLLVAQAGLVILTFGILLRLCTLRSGSPKLSVFMLLLVLPVTAHSWTPRSQMFALPLFAGFLFVLSDWRWGLVSPRLTAADGDSRSHRLWLLPPLMALWVNLHGSFVLGGVLIVLYALGTELGRRLSGEEGRTSAEEPPPSLAPLVLWGAVTAAAILLNPRGLNVLGYVTGLMSNPAITSIVTEWAPTSVDSLDGRVFFAFATLLALVSALGRRRPAILDVVLVTAFFWLALGGRRHVVWFGLVAAPLLATQAASFPAFRAWCDRDPQSNRRLNAAFLAIVALIGFLVLPWNKRRLSLPPQIAGVLSASTPVEAVDFLRDLDPKPARLFHSVGGGSYLMWAASDQKVFVDPRITLYPSDLWNDYQALSAGRQVDSLLTYHRIDGVLIDKDRQAPLLSVLRHRPLWVEAYEDDHHAYLARMSPSL